MKKIMAMVLSGVMMVNLVACSKAPDTTTTGSAAQSGNSIQDGKYKGTSSGKGGEIQVEIQIKDDQIVSAQVLTSSETEGFDTAMKTLEERIITANSIEVDLVAGCTLTSTGFLEAVEDALTQAGATADMLKKVEVKVENKEKEVVQETHDIIVIGAGGAGLSAAIEAKMAGADVIVLEKMPMAGGNTLISGAEYAAPGNWIQEEQGIEDSTELMANDMIKGGDNENNPELVKVVAENALDGAVWLRDVVGVEWEEELMFFGGHSVKRSLIPLGASGQEIIRKQLAKAEELEIPILVNTKATDLIQDETGKVVGVKAEGQDKDYEFTTNKSVIIASGGFGSNIEMRKANNPAMDEKILSTNSKGITGDGIILAQNAGAGVTDMEYIQTYPICDPLTGTLLYYDDARLYGHTILVNKEGKRFVEELERRDVISMAITEQTGSVTYELLDQAGFEASNLEANHSKELDYLYKNDLLVKADTLEEAAAFFDIDAVQLQKTVDEYNEYIKAGKDLAFNKRLLTEEIGVGPFYILKAVPAVHHTMGGLTINTEAQVLTPDGQVIEGLYAAGEVTGDIHGTNRLGSNALADITVFGRIAGQNASK